MGRHGMAVAAEPFMLSSSANGWRIAPQIGEMKGCSPDWGFEFRIMSKMTISLWRGNYFSSGSAYVLRSNGRTCPTSFSRTFFQERLTSHLVYDKASVATFWCFKRRYKQQEQTSAEPLRQGACNTEVVDPRRAAPACGLIDSYKNCWWQLKQKHRQAGTHRWTVEILGPTKSQRNDSHDLLVSWRERSTSMFTQYLIGHWQWQGIKGMW